MMEPRIPIDHAKIEAFCQKWKMSEFSLFGSVLRDDFRPDSDVDVLVTFAPDAKWRPWDLDEAESDLKLIFGRNVDLVERKCVEQSRNYIRRKHILSTTQVVYAPR